MPYTPGREVRPQDKFFFWDLYYPNFGMTGPISFAGDTVVEGICIKTLDAPSLDVSRCTSLKSLNFYSDSATSVILTGCNSIVALDVGYTSAGILPSIDLSPVTSVQYLGIGSNVMTSLDLTVLTALKNVTFSYNNNMSSITLPSTAPDLTGFYSVECALPESEVDAILAFLDAQGASNGGVDLSGGSNAAPSASGLTSKANLEGKGWSVAVN